MSTSDSNSTRLSSASTGRRRPDVSQQIRDISEVPAIEVITTAAVHLMSAAAVKLGLAAEDNAEELKDLDEARKLITALAGLVTAAAPEIGSQHAGPLRDGLRSLQLAFREDRSFRTPRARARAKSSPGRLTSRQLPKQHTTAGGPPKWSPAVVVYALFRSAFRRGARGGGAGDCSTRPARQRTTPAVPTADKPGGRTRCRR